MPKSAIERFDVDHVKPAAEIGSLLHQLINCGDEVPAELGEDQVDVSEGLISALRLNGVPAPSPFICPECKGALWEVQDGGTVQYRCHVGHGFGVDTLMSMQSIDIEQALWSAVRGFEEKAELQRRSALRTDIGDGLIRKRLLESAREQQQMADVVRSLLVGPKRSDQSPVGESVKRAYTG
jgi:two-component system chemotaxis response regulator CheB